jgi:transposase-like protein
MGILSKEQVKDVIKLYGIKTVADAHNAVKDIFKDVIQNALESELETKLGYSKYDYKNKETSNNRNGYSDKTVRSSLGEIELDVPRDREGEYSPVIVKKGQRDISNIEDKILSMYASGMATRDIGKQMNEIYGIELSIETISKITDKIIPIIKEWQNRPLLPIYMIVYLDAIVLSVKTDGVATKKSFYVVMGIDNDGMKDVLGIWAGTNESAKYWLTVLNEIKNRGVKDILICCVDGLKGFDEAINTVFPATEIQRCIVHQIRYCCKYVNYKDRKEFCTDMKEIYNAPTEEAGRLELNKFSEKWGKKYLYAIKSWENNWNNLATFYKYPSEIKRLIYTTNPIESLNSTIRTAANPKRVFPTEDAALKIMYLSIRRRIDKWTMRTKNWGLILAQLNSFFPERIYDAIK